MVISNEVLVLSLLVVLGVLFYLVFRWAQKNEQASYLGKVFQEAVFDFELSRRTRRVDEKRGRGEYERDAMTQDDWIKTTPYPDTPTPPPKLRPYMQRRGSTRPPGLPGLGSSGDAGGYGTTDPWDEVEERYFLGMNPEELPEEIKPIHSSYMEALNDYETKKSEWKRRLSQAIEQRYQDDRKKARENADKAAKSAADVDMAVFRGRGPTFVLEFTAVVVIMFSAVILAILDKLGPEQVGTLLAAIAGYVLGRATARVGEGERQGNERSQRNTAREDSDT